MTQERIHDLLGTLSGQSTRNQYIKALGLFDEAICEATAVGQAQAGREVSPCLGYSSFLFGRLCAHGVAMVRAAPYSRWVKADHHDWDFSVVACHARAILEGYLYFSYLIAPEDEASGEGRARITLMQLNDCCSRLKLFQGDAKQRAWFEEQKSVLQLRLKTIPFFQQMSKEAQQACLAGKKAWFKDRQQLVEAVGWEKATFDIYWDLWSQHAHIHPISFYRMEPNGRGSGLECDPDRLYTTTALLMCAGILIDCTDRMVEAFPDVANVRKGLDSKFTLGPKRNRPR